MRPTSNPLLFVIILNWNGWRYTLPCLESVLRSDCESLRIIVCDNGSADGSVKAMEQWAKDQAEPPGPLRRHLAHLATQPKPRNVTSLVVREHQPYDAANYGESDVIFLLRQSNDGYAAGNNSALRLALRLGADYVWILNNDTLVEPTAARRLVNHMRADNQCGLCGTTIRSYDNPEQIQLLAGWHYNQWLARPTPLLDESELGVRLSYISGASVCASRSFLETIGLMCDEYFLYGEEMDWAARAKGFFSLGYCRDAVVYHKGGASTGGLSDDISEYCGVRARLILTRKFWPQNTFVVRATMILRVILRASQGDMAKARSILLALAGRPYRDKEDSTVDASDVGARALLATAKRCNGD